MQIAQALSGYTLGEADLLRRAMGKKIKAEMDAQRARFVEGAVERGVARADAVMIFDLVAKFAELRLQQVARGGLCAGRLPDGLSEGEFPGRVPGGVDDARHGQHRQAQRIPPGGAAARHRGRAARHQPLRRRLRGRRREHRLRARGAEGRGHAGGRALWSRCAAPSAFQNLADFASRIDPQIVNRKALECLVQAGAFDTLEPHRAKVFENIGRILAAAQERTDAPASGIVDLFGRRRRADAALPCRGRSVAAGGAPAARIRRGRHVSQRPSDRRLRRHRAGARRAYLEGVPGAAARHRISSPASSPPPSCSGRSGARAPAAASASSRFPTRRGQFEATVYQERLADWRETAGARPFAVLVRSAANSIRTREEVRARIQNIEPLEAAAAKKSRADPRIPGRARSRSSGSRAGSTRARGPFRSCSC